MPYNQNIWSMPSVVLLLKMSLIQMKGNKCIDIERKWTLKKYYLQCTLDLQFNAFYNTGQPVE